MKSRKVEVRKPVGLKQRSAAADGVSVSLSGITSIQAKAIGPGEVAGPALRVTVKVQNSTKDRVDLSAAVVNLSDAKGDPGSSMTGPPAKALPSVVDAGTAATGVYVFTVPRSRRNPVRVEVGLAAALPTVVFTGKG